MIVCSIGSDLCGSDVQRKRRRGVIRLPFPLHIILHTEGCGVVHEHDFLREMSEERKQIHAPRAGKGREQKKTPAAS